MKSTTLLLLLISLSLPVYGQSASHERAAREVLEASNAKIAVEATYGQLLPQLRSMSERLGVTKEQLPIFEKYLQRMVRAMKEELSWEKMEPHLIAVYTDVYDEQELLELAEFYRSPLGRKFVAKMPELMQATMGAVQEMMPAYIARLQNIQKELQAELVQAAADSP